MFAEAAEPRVRIISESVFIYPGDAVCLQCAVAAPLCRSGRNPEVIQSVLRTADTASWAQHGPAGQNRPVDRLGGTNKTKLMLGIQ